MESVHSTVMQQQHWLQVPQSEAFLISLSAGFSALTHGATLQEHAENSFIFVSIWIFQLICFFKLEIPK